MRLTCPNCDAQYEVDDNAIPENGRDVQCSNCGHAWFQLPPDLEDAPPAGKPIGAPAEEPEEAAAEPLVPPAPVAEVAPEPEPEPDHGEDVEEALGEVSMPAVAAPRRALNDGLKQLLREEADRETAARQAEGGGIEMQPDLGLESGAPGQKPAPQDGDGPESHLREDSPSPEAASEDEAEAGAVAGAVAGAAAPAGAARRDLLPDIEEINSTLRATSERGSEEPGASADAETPAERRRGFRRGFSTILLVAVLLALLYLYAPKIVQSVPSAAGPLNSYVQTVDKGRSWLNGMMQRATRALTGGKAEDGS